MEGSEATARLGEAVLNLVKATLFRQNNGIGGGAVALV
jgi:hypothetical protein